MKWGFISVLPTKNKIVLDLNLTKIFEHQNLIIEKNLHLIFIKPAVRSSLPILFKIRLLMPKSYQELFNS